MEFIYLVLFDILILFVHNKLMSDNTILDIVTILGQWAIVTGATDGIGKALAQELAQMGYDTGLVSRNQDKLEATACEIQKKFNVSTKTIQADFSSSDHQMYSRIKSELQNMDIGVLVNNVGVSCSHPEHFLELEKRLGLSYTAMMNVNVISMVQITGNILPRMIEKRKGLIINISSQASKIPTPLFTVYGATKSFVTKFSQDLDTEYRSKGVNVHVLTTGLVTTKLSGIEKRSFFCPMPQTYAKSALDEVSRKRCSDGYIGHTLVSYINTIAVFLISDVVLDNLVLKFLSHAKATRVKRCEEWDDVDKSEKGSHTVALVTELR